MRGTLLERSRHHILGRHRWAVQDGTFQVFNPERAVWAVRVTTTYLSEEGKPEVQLTVLAEGLGYIALTNEDLPALKQWLEQHARKGYPMESHSQNYIDRKKELEDRTLAIAHQVFALEEQKKAIEEQIRQLRTSPLTYFNVTDGADHAWCLRCGIKRFVGISGVDFTVANIAAYEVNVRGGYIGNKRFVGSHDEPLEELRLSPGEVRHCADCGEVLKEEE